MSQIESDILANIEALKGTDNKDGRPLEHYVASFAQGDVAAMARRSGLESNEDNTELYMDLLGRKLKLMWPSGEAFYLDDGSKLSIKETILVLRLACEGMLTEDKDKWLAYEEVPWGEAYLQPFRGRCIMRFTYMFPNSAALSVAAEKAGGRKVDSSADAAFEFDFLGPLKMRLLYWDRDEEFEPQAQILFSDNFPLAFTAEDMAHCGDIILGYLKSFK